MGFSFYVELLTFVFDCQKTVQKNFIFYNNKNVLISLLDLTVYAIWIYCIKYKLLVSVFFFFFGVGGGGGGGWFRERKEKRITEYFGH